jgi:hypothetical protein
MKRILFILLTCSALAHSQTYYMNVWSKGKITSVPIQSIQRITFSQMASGVDHTVNDKVATVVSNFQLLQNYPNPFNPSTAIQYQIPNAGLVEVRIFSIKGELVKVFSNNYASAGAYSVIWDGKNESGQSVASGMYIYCVTFGRSVMSRKMTFIK